MQSEKKVCYMSCACAVFGQMLRNFTVNVARLVFDDACHRFWEALGNVAILAVRDVRLGHLR